VSAGKVVQVPVAERQKAKGREEKEEQFPAKRPGLT